MTEATGRWPAPERVCRRCMGRAVPGDRYCTTCGARLEVPRTAVPAALLAAVGGVAVTAIIAGLLAVASDPDVVAGEASPSLATRTPAASPVPSDVPIDLGEPFGTLFDERSAFCGAGQLTCHMLSVPADQLAPDDDADPVSALFGMRRADLDDERLGTLVIATGGPGTSGVQYPELYLDRLSDAVLERYDVVLFEQRGVGRSDGVSCGTASAERQSWIGLAVTSADAALRAARDWTNACLAEAGVADIDRLDRYATYHAAADLDAYLDLIGAGQVTFLAESYGTALAQTYARERPQRVAGLILDAVIDLEVGPIDATVEQAAAFGEVLDRVLAACADDVLCEADMSSGSAAEAWDALAALLASGPVSVEMPTGRGAPAVTDLRREDLVSLASGLLYTEFDRSRLLRLLAAADRGDLVPMARTASLWNGRDPDSGEVLSNMGDIASFYAIDCQDFSSRSAESDARRLIRDATSQESARVLGLATHVLPCLTGFSGGAEPVGGERGTDAHLDIPALLLTSTADAATPTAWAEAVHARMPNSYLVVTTDSSHGTFGWGLPCPDELVEDFLLFGHVPDEPLVRCDGYLVDFYSPLPMGSLDAYPDLVEAIVAVEQELVLLPDHQIWNGYSRAVGCRHGGWARLSWSNTDKFDLHDCAVIPDWPLDGQVRLRPDGSATMSLRWADGDAVEYTRDADWSITVTGEVGGEPFEERR